MSTADAASGDFAGNVDIGDGRGLYLECHGSGSPTVVLLSGFGNAGDIWYLTADRPPAVAPAVAGFTRVCSYDRSGSYVSSKVVGDAVVPLEPPQPYAPARGTAVAVPRSTAAAAVADLKSLLTAARVPGPYVLVGHSLGGLFAQLYARTHPDDVAGLVFVDATTPQIRDLASPTVYATMLTDMVAQAPTAIPGYVNETYDINASVDEIAAAPPVPAVPAVVLIAGQGQSMTTLPPGITRADLADLFRVGQRALRSFGAGIGARAVLVPDSSHYIHVIEPNAVITAIRDVIDETRAEPR